ncbi:TPA: hypothetical protein N0F65_004071 [Lagenidium giganteum]|uniref:Uncharacterized protein n=1 Tax=Lagenidium giganteum TaxID=4803 RepID=A0AAV2Z049_9STRA|nr:TPA: hypothetical protein N0F65_004071 [Lagenidium giganteum]
MVSASNQQSEAGKSGAAEDDEEEEDDDDDDEGDNDDEEEDDVGGDGDEDGDEDKGKGKGKGNAKVLAVDQAVALRRSPDFRPKRPQDHEGTRVTQQKEIGHAWENGPRIDVPHFKFVQADYARRQGAVDFIRERMHKKSRPGFELRVRRKWTVSEVVHMLLRRHLSFLPCVIATMADAAWDGDILQVHGLLLMRADVNSRDSNGQLVLNICIQQQHEPIIRLLIDRGADFNLQDEESKMTPLINSIIMGNKALTRRLLKRGARVDVADAEGMTAMLWAAMRGYLEIVAQLLEHGADVNHQDGEGWTALHIVCFKGYYELVEYLLVTARARFDLEDVNGFTPLLYAQLASNDDVVKKLDEHMADVASGKFNGRYGRRQQQKKKKKRTKKKTSQSTIPSKNQFATAK